MCKRGKEKRIVNLRAIAKRSNWDLWVVTWCRLRYFQFLSHTICAPLEYNFYSILWVYFPIHRTEPTTRNVDLYIKKIGKPDLLLPSYFFCSRVRLANTCTTSWKSVVKLVQHVVPGFSVLLVDYCCSATAQTYSLTTCSLPLVFSSSRTSTTACSHASTAVIVRYCSFVVSERDEATLHVTSTQPLLVLLSLYLSFFLCLFAVRAVKYSMILPTVPFRLFVTDICSPFQSTTWEIYTHFYCSIKSKKTKCPSMSLIKLLSLFLF